MKILLINGVCGKGSTGRLCWELAREADAAGDQAVIAYGRAAAEPDCAAQSYRIGTALQVGLHGLQTRLFDRHGFGSRLSTAAFIRWVRRFDPDVIHLHNIHGYYINIELLFRFLRDFDRPVIWTLHDCWAFTGHCAHYAPAGCQRWRSGCGECPQLCSYPAALMDGSRKNHQQKKALFTAIDKLTLVTPCRWLRQQAQLSFLCHAPVRMIPNGIDTDLFKPTASALRARYGLEGKRILLGVACSWSDEKGLSLFSPLAAALGRPWQVVLLGIRPHQRRLLSENILALPMASQAELAQWYTAADVFANLSLADTFPTVLLEAQACGTPVVCFDTGGSAEALWPAMKDRWLCPEANPALLARAVCQAAQCSPQQSQQLRAWCCAQFSKALCMERYRDLYAEVVRKEVQL